MSQSVYEILANNWVRALVIARGETTHSGVDVINTHLSMINPDYNMMQAIFVRTNQYSAY